MPIYAYRCAACGHAQDVLQKISDPVLTRCPVCGADAFQKQVTAAGFQLKGSGWYVTDFRGGNNAGAKDGKDGKVADGGAKPADAPATADAQAAPAKPADKAAAPTPAPPSASPPPSSSSGS
jgi:putative FmdB family regulatory protein